MSYTEDDGAVLLEQGTNAVIGDVDSPDLDGGSLTVSFASGNVPAEDVLSIRNQGNRCGQVGVSGSDVTFAGTIVGSFTGGTGGADLVITFNANSTPLAATQILQNITYENANTSALTTGTRGLNVVVTDGDGGASVTNSVSINVSAENDAPVLDNSGTMTLTTINEDDITNNGDLVSAIVSSAGGDRITDVDPSAVEGLAIIDRNYDNGEWEYSTDGGTSWNLVGSVSDANALLLRATDRIRSYRIRKTSPLHGSTSERGTRRVARLASRLMRQPTVEPPRSAQTSNELRLP